ncbi:glycosyltransferase [Penaeicola halotolerans]|uniref:glycosyltransferase n=1 Tax=Penaeicola halotolerans TaxID=2793196 RepID=UPI001CF854FC|nr:glycosyltransferase [Penaeicola halotolerans]
MEVVFGIFIGTLCIQLFYNLYFFAALGKKKKIQTPHPTSAPVSVIVAARNEAHNLPLLIEHVLLQEHPDFELIIVNDRSTDDTEDLLNAYQNRYPNKIKVVHVRYLPDHLTGKKYALTLGILKAQHDLLLLTDADCKPVSAKWIHQMTAPFVASEVAFVLGFSNYKKYPGILNRFIRFETLVTAMLYLGMAIKGVPFMGVGRNIAYKRSFFISKKGFKGFYHLVGGDDDLFVNRYANAKNTRVVTNPEAMTLSEPKRTLSEYLIQKRRHLHIGKFYKFSTKWILGAYHLSHLALWILGITLISVSFGTTYVILGFIVKSLVAQWVIQKSNSRLHAGFETVGVLLFDLVHLLYFWMIGTRGFFSKKVRWK